MDNPNVYESLTDPPGYPIISGINGLSDPIGKLIDYCLHPLVETLPSYVKYSSDILAKMDNIQLEPDTILATCNVESLLDTQMSGSSALLSSGVSFWAFRQFFFTYALGLLVKFGFGPKSNFSQQFCEPAEPSIVRILVNSPWGE